MASRSQNLCRKQKSNETRDYNGVRNDYLSRPEHETKSKVMKTQKINVARKAFYIKSKFANESLEVFGEDHFDFEKIMSTID